MNNKLDDRAKKILFLFAGIILIIIFMCIIAFIIGKSKNTSLSYSEIEQRMVEAAKSYYSRNEEALPFNEEDKNVEVSVSTLISEGLLNELSSYNKNESIACDGKVKVTKSGDYYNYSPYLDCGDNYRTIYLYEKLLDGVVTTDDGLYKTTQYSKQNGNVTRYIFRGEYPNNYVSINGMMWRIVKLNEDNTITLIHSKVNTSDFDAVVWDDRYNKDTDDYDGINNFDESRIKRTLERYYDKFLSESSKEKMVKITNCVGTRLNNDTKNDGSLECSKIAEDSFVTLLPVYDFINASLDKNCNNISSKSCSNYNYLAKYSDIWWTLTVNKNYTTTAYVINRTASRRELSSEAYVRMVIKLTENTIYSSGDGTSQSPYTVK